mmetsp:Transcript_39941/g.87164  ORF Transcript_39941/g.87164 Transcript_39941/m.87164 type:complete len:213 (+) Transcript_39941:142-780(+)
MVVELVDAHLTRAAMLGPERAVDPAGVAHTLKIQVLRLPLCHPLLELLNAGLPRDPWGDLPGIGPNTQDHQQHSQWGEQFQAELCERNQIPRSHIHDVCYRGDGDTKAPSQWEKQIGCLVHHRAALLGSGPLCHALRVLDRVLQKCHEHHVLPAGGDVETCPPLAILELRVGTVLQQKLDHRSLVGQSCSVHRSHPLPIHIPQIHIKVPKEP